ncbi:MAG: SGNH/GDSL hydrolase family protein [Verrucomicrobiota bacterium]|jgi:lysophospholipase L1-like esterase|nr:SGNH/GDSL hydrolase family protein [Verrucomicrobiota bacterium]
MKNESDRRSALPGLSRVALWGLKLLDVTCLLAVAVLPLAWFFDPVVVRAGGLRLSISWTYKPILAAAGLIALRWVWRGGLKRHGASFLPASRLFRMGCLAVLPTFLLLVGLEGLARWVGIQPVEAVPIVVTGKEAPTEPAGRNMRGDPELLYEFEPHAQWEGMEINRHGFRTRDFAVPKATGMVRVMCLGDSCTAQGNPPYSDRLHALLQAEPPDGRPWEAFNMGVHGYSVLQGLRQFQRYGPVYQPDVVTIFFGWNDHWLSTRPDRQRMGVRMHPASAALVGGLQKKRLYAWLASVLERGPGEAASSRREVVRVPLPDYREALKELIREIRAVGAVPIVLTAPRDRLHDMLVRYHHAESPAEGERRHDAYVEATRQVAAEEEAALLDLARLFDEGRYEKVFMGDGIHFREAGLQHIASALDRTLRELAAEEGFPSRGKE